MANEPATKERSATDTPPDGVAPSGNGQQSPGSRENAEAKPADPRRRTIVWVVVIAFGVLALIYGVRYYGYSQTHVTTDDAYVTGNLVNVSPIISGTLSRLTVDEGDNVTKGELIAVLDDSGEIAGLHQAQAAYSAAESQVPQARTDLAYEQATTDAGIEKAQAALRTQQAKIGGALAQKTLTQATVSNQVTQAEQQVATSQALAAQSDAQSASQQEAVSASEQAVQTAQRAEAASRANVESAAATFHKDQADEQRYRRLLAQEAVTQEQYDVVQAASLSADAQLSQARDQADQAQSQIDQARVAVQQAVAQAVASRRAAEAAHRQVDVARAGLALAEANNSQNGIQQNNFLSNQSQGSEAQADLATAEAGRQQILLKQQQITTLQTQASQAQAVLANAQVQENDTRIYAPSDGEVVRKGVNVGAALSPGQTILTMTDGNNVWIEANYKETQMAGVKPGEKVEVTVDAYPGKIFLGHVESIDNATGASTALLPPDNATGNFTKVVQRIPVKIALDPAKSTDGSQYATAADIANLRQGMSANPTIALGQ
jgi:membrane fusion protein, multidrug efflux system